MTTGTSGAGLLFASLLVGAASLGLVRIDAAEVGSPALPGMRISGFVGRGLDRRIKLVTILLLASISVSSCEKERRRSQERDDQ